MVDHGIAERLQPSLLDRLTDDDPTNPKETRESRVIDIRRLREIIQRDLAWLLNTFDNSSMIDAERYPNVSNSVLAYGVEEVAGEFATNLRAAKIRASIQRAIEKYEPRIIGGSLDVILRDTLTKGQTLVTFDIAADMWAQPLPMELYLRSEVDMTTGELKLERPGPGTAPVRRR
ncbi:type VI secretion system baseplate subunit TssE [Pseudorhodobacter sp.]|uniref:type VI secretion system baseplate subunit TssE n=1 Tax=Pseudorhodobacter sp. TaxID=1934400 RepID=UPI0026497D68|nr:type VI secretion system baseplate subunit TssE [Pseudorhodobacter sp.]MDN5787192.1 type VI secretion system baseplate subunit TssE [Pseudorhodobacter sp.]